MKRTEYNCSIWFEHTAYNVNYAITYLEMRGIDYNMTISSQEVEVDTSEKYEHCLDRLSKRLNHQSHKVDYCRVDFDNNTYVYLENDELCGGEWRSHKLVKVNYKYIRIKRMKTLPQGKVINEVYHKTTGLTYPFS